MASAAPNFLRIIDAYEAGADRAERSRLQDLAERGRMLQGQALQGDQNALAELGKINPEAYMQTQSFTNDQKKQRLGEFLSAAYGAKTPEAWGSVVQRFKAQGHQFGPGEDAFENRENLIRQGMSVADQMGYDFRADEAKRSQANADRTFNADQAYKDKYLGILQQKADQTGTGGGRGQITDVGGKRVLINPQTGEVIKELGASPSSMPKAAGPMSASMLKLRRETENNILNIKNTQAVLGRARALADKAFEGYGASARAAIGTKAPWIPGVGAVADPAGAAATTEYGNIMSMEAIQAMSNSLKGATTDFELKKFEGILSDPSVPASIKKQTIDRMLQYSNSQLALEEQRLSEFGSEMPQQGQGAPDQQQGSNDTYQNNIDAALQDANDAIAAGADKEKVMQRFRDMFPDAEIE